MLRRVVDGAEWCGERLGVFVLLVFGGLFIVYEESGYLLDLGRVKAKRARSWMRRAFLGDRW